MKRLVVCCDGTWNTQDQTDRGVPAPTNVAKLHAAVLAEAGDGTVQKKYYHPGVGTSPGIFDKVMGGGIGAGLDKNIMSAYRNLCDNYQADDEIYLFGFSRGAYTVRSLAGLISRCKLLDTSDLDDNDAWARIEVLFQDGYRERKKVSEWRDKEWNFHQTTGGSINIPITFMGVWDTVGALGIPDDMALLNILDKLHDHSFHDTKLGSNIDTARHAVALDELRGTFQPTMWTDTKDNDIKQIWFPGVHSDVGGGYAETGLSDGPLSWMIVEAGRKGLEFAGKIVDQIAPDHHAVLHNSLSGPFELLPTQPRSIPSLSQANGLHESAIERRKNPPIAQAPYRSTRSLPNDGQPVSIDIYAIEPWNDTGIWLEKGVKYQLEATGEWKDKSIPCGPAGADDGKFQLGEIAHLFGSVIGKAEELFKTIGGNDQANFLMTKRHEDIPWFCLTGAIANGGGAKKNKPIPHETFAIGDGCTLTPKKSGYLYAYANDAWRFYENNRGRVQLAIAKA